MPKYTNLFQTFLKFPQTFSSFVKLSSCSSNVLLSFGNVQNYSDYSGTLTFVPKIPKQLLSSLNIFTNFWHLNWGFRRTACQKLRIFSETSGVFFAECLINIYVILYSLHASHLFTKQLLPVFNLPDDGSVRLLVDKWLPSDLKTIICSTPNDRRLVISR